MLTNPHRRSVLIAAAATSALEATGCATWRDPVSVEKYILGRSKEWTNSYVTGNPEVMERILAHDFVNTNPRGERSGKTAAIASAKDGPATIQSAQAGAIEVRVFGSMAIAFGGDILLLKEGSRREITTAWTDTWLFREDEWLAVASHESVVQSSSRG